MSCRVAIALFPPDYLFPGEKESEGREGDNIRLSVAIIYRWRSSGDTFPAVSRSFRCIVGAREQVYAELRVRPHMHIYVYIYIHTQYIYIYVCMYIARTRPYVRRYICMGVYVYRRRMSQMESGKLVSIGIRLIMVPHRSCMNS